MGQVDVSILQHMRDNIKGGFDEERHASRVGFGNLKRWVGRVSGAVGQPVAQLHPGTSATSVPYPALPVAVALLPNSAAAVGIS